MPDENNSTPPTTAVVPSTPTPATTLVAFDGVYGSAMAFEQGQRMARALAASELVPTQYRGNVANALIALDIAQRMNLSPLLVMQNLNIIYGRPSWSSQFIIAAINASGKFSPLRFVLTGEAGKDTRTCVAWAVEKSTGERLDSPPVSIAMAKQEGWWSRKDQNGRETSKWQTMSELMLRYRTAAFFGRLYAPEVLNGLPSAEEVLDITPIDVTPTGRPGSSTGENREQHVEPATELTERANKRRAKKAAETTDATPAQPPQTSAEPPPAEDDIPPEGGGPELF